MYRGFCSESWTSLHEILYYYFIKEKCKSQKHQTIFLFLHHCFLAFLPFVVDLKKKKKKTWYRWIICLNIGFTLFLYCYVHALKSTCSPFVNISFLSLMNFLLFFQLGSRVPSVTSPVGINTRTPPKKPSIGQKKPLEALGSSPPLPR